MSSNAPRELDIAIQYQAGVVDECTSTQITSYIVKRDLQILSITAPSSAKVTAQQPRSSLVFVRGLIDNEGSRKRLTALAENATVEIQEELKRCKIISIIISPKSSSGDTLASSPSIDPITPPPTSRADNTIRTSKRLKTARSLPALNHKAAGFAAFRANSSKKPRTSGSGSTPTVTKRVDGKGSGLRITIKRPSKTLPSSSAKPITDSESISPAPQSKPKKVELFMMSSSPDASPTPVSRGTKRKLDTQSEEQGGVARAADDADAMDHREIEDALFAELSAQTEKLHQAHWESKAENAEKRASEAERRASEAKAQRERLQSEVREGIARCERLESAAAAATEEIKGLENRDREAREIRDKTIDLIRSAQTKIDMAETERMRVDRERVRMDNRLRQYIHLLEGKLKQQESQDTTRKQYVDNMQRLTERIAILEQVVLQVKDAVQVIRIDSESALE